MIDQVNGQINAIHDHSIELTDFIGCFSPLNLDELEIKVCRLADARRIRIYAHKVSCTTTADNTSG